MIIPSKVYVTPVYIKQFYLYSVGKRMSDTETTPVQLQLPTHALAISFCIMYVQIFTICLAKIYSL